MENEFSTRKVDPLFTQELRRERIIVESLVPNITSKISNITPYSSLFSSLAGNYMFTFYGNDDEVLYSVELSIESNNFNIISKDPNLIIKNDDVKLIHRGQNIHLEFEVLGVSYLQKVSIYIKTYDLKNPKKDIFGVYSGIDVNNNPINGKVKIEISD